MKNSTTVGDSTSRYSNLSVEYAAAATRRASVFSSSRERLSRNISPPPLKRQRTETDVPRYAALSTAIPSVLHSSFGTGSRSFDGSTAGYLSDKHRKPWGPEGIARSSSFTAPFADSDHGPRNIQVSSRRNSLALSRRSSGTGSASQRACRVCEKSTATMYDPIITCPTCDRPYHDSCRRPPLAEGSRPDLWRCSKCSRGDQARKEAVRSGASGLRSSMPGFGKYMNGRSNLEGVHRESPSDPRSSAADFQSISQKHSGTPPRNVDIGSSSKAASVPSHQGRTDGNSGNTHTDKRGSAVHSGRASFLSTPLKDTPETLLPGPVESVKPEEPLKIIGSELSSRTEIPPTPTQRSSQIPVLEHYAARSYPHSSVEGEGNDSLLLVQSQIAELTPRTEICEGCRTQWVLVKEGNELINCHKCRSRSRIAESGKLEIPESPDIGPSQYRSAPVPSQRLDSSVLDPASVSTRDPATLRSDLNAVKPDIVQKKTGPDTMACELIPSCEIVEGLSDVDILPNDDQSTKQPSMPVAAPITDHLLATSDEPLQHVKEQHMSPLSAGDIPDLMPVPTQDVHEQRALPSPDDDGDFSPVRGSQIATHVKEVEDCAKMLPVAHQTATESADVAHKVQPTAESEGLALSGLETPAPSIPDRSYTLRELVIIALVAAGGSSLTALQIIDWLAENFTHLRKGQGRWEKSIKSVLSNTPEFAGRKIGGKSLLYGFANTATEELYHQEYHEYTPKLSPDTPQPTIPVAGNDDKASNVPSPEFERHGRPQGNRARKSAPSALNAKLIKPELSLRVLPPRRQPTRIAICDDPSFMPFGRTQPLTEERKFFLETDVQGTAGFYKTILHSQKPSIETMTEEEKARKIGEIKARPSRKTFFGSEVRLGHVRRYGKKDIHDESDGAWKASCSGAHDDREKVSMDEKTTEKAKMLQVTFGLPANAIPMNDGHTELAFRDGTLVNGKLPRSRQIYRVGRLFGGELTVRTS